MRALVILLSLAVGCTGTTASDGTDEPTDHTDGPGADFFPQSLEKGAFGAAITPGEYVCGSGVSTCDTSACGTNTAPVLGTPVLIVNGYISTTVSAGDEVMVAVPFEDADCNLGCGGVSFYYEAPDAAFDSEASTCEDQPCSTAESGVYMAVGLGTVQAGGSYSASMRITDACGDRSNSADTSFSL